MPDPETLRQEYNENYRQSVDRWSCHESAQATAIVALVLGQLRAAGRPATGRLLDVGCAKGHLCEAFRQAGLEANGLDYSDVAIARARTQFPQCQFHHMDGFNPRFDRRFDLIFMRGFSGCNTLDLAAVATLANKYVALLSPDGCFVLAYSTDFSGRHRLGDTACWSRAQLRELSARIRAHEEACVFAPRLHALTRLKLTLGRLLGRRSKVYFYLFFRHPGGPAARSTLD